MRATRHPRLRGNDGVDRQHRHFLAASAALGVTSGAPTLDKQLDFRCACIVAPMCAASFVTSQRH